MSGFRAKQKPLRLADAGKRDVRTQFAALIWRVHKDAVQVLLVTTRRTGRWILPKGWPMDGATPSEAAETEAWEEAGVRGTAKPVCLGLYSYTKDIDKNESLPCMVAVFPLKARKTESAWPEKDTRKRKWFTAKKAAALVREPELAAILKAFDPQRL